MTGTAEVPFIFLSPFYSPLSLTRDFSCCYYDLGLFCFYTCTAYVPIHKQHSVVSYATCFM